MHCATCGKENSSDKKFCKYCGNPLVYEDNKDNNSDNISTSISETSQKTDDSYKVLKYVVIALITIVLILVLSIVIYLIYTNKSNKNTNVTETVISDNVAEPAEEVEEDFTTNISNGTEEADIEAVAVEDFAEEAEEAVIDESEQEVYEAEEDAGEEMELSQLPVSYVEASSELNVKSVDNATYVAGNVADGDLKTSWVEGVEGRGEGQVIVLHLDGSHKIAGLKIYTGFLKTWARYVKNGKVTTVLIDYCNGQTQEVDLTYNWGLSEEDIDFDESTAETCSTVITTEQICETDTIKITIINAVAGSKYEDTAISEIEVYGY